MKKLIFSIWILVLAVVINIDPVFSQNQWFWQNPLPQSNSLSSVYFNDMYTGRSVGERDSSNWTSQISGTVNNLRSVFFIDNETGWTVGEFGTILKTTNGGVNWTFQISGTYNDLYSIYFIDRNNGCIVGDHIILNTSNGGSIWSYASGTSQDVFFSVQFIDINTGWAVGLGGIILKTTNGGTNWVTLSSGTTEPLTSVSFINNTTGWIVSYDGSILKTTNGGIEYQITQISPDERFSSVQFIDNNTGWIAGAPPYGIFNTTNGGDSWVSQIFNLHYYIKSVCFSDGNAGWAAGNQGIILKTTNGGSNWITESSITNNDLISIIFKDNSIWTVGLGGTILYKYDISVPNDVGVTSIIEPSLDSIHYVDCINNKIVSPRVRLRNFGTNDQNSFFDIKIEIMLNGSLAYSDTKQDTLSKGLIRTINFDPFTILGTETGTYTVKSWTCLQTDTNHSNDTAASTFFINNPNFGNDNLSAIGYHFANSTLGASCAQDQPTFYWEDTTGSVNLIANGIAIVPFSGGNLNNGYFILANILPGNLKFQLYGVCYDTFVISTNGIIGLGNSIAGMLSDNPIQTPSSSAPKPAIFPFWYTLNFGGTPMAGRNLKYKVATGGFGGTKVIFTYDRVHTNPYSPDINDYVSFQVILEPSGICGPNCNGLITIQYDNSKCGSSFLNKYYNNQLGAHTVGIQNKTGDISIQYRYGENWGSIVTPGPLFSSPLALTFGPYSEVLPVELMSFTSNVNENNVTLNWQTNSESNNSGFDIERSNVKDQWSKAGSVQGNGNSNEPKDYSFTDKNLAPGKYNYRLKQIDFNGSFEYYDLTGEVVVGVPDKYELSQNYPNPFNPVTVIRYALTENGFTNLKIYDITGREVAKLVNEKQDAGRYEVTFNGSNFASGVYFYELRSGEFVSQKRMFLLK